jgi:HlyD family secretion protein
MIDELATDRPAPKLKLRADSREIAAADPSDSATPILLEFESPTAAVLARPVPLRSRYMTWIVSSIFFVLLWLAYAVPIDRVVSTTGKVVATAPNIVVQPLETAIVRSIDVKDGDLVRKGQLLAQLDPTIAAADAGAAQAQVASLQAEVDRLTAESNNRVYLSDGTQPSELQAVIFAQRHAEYSYKLENYQQKIDSLQSKVAQAQADIASYTERLALARTLEAKRRELERLQVGSQLNTLAAVDNRVEIARSLDIARTSAIGAKRDLDAMIAERDAYIQQTHAETSQQLTDQGRKLQQARDDLAKARLRHSLVQLRADRDAIVLSIAPVSVGSVMQSGDQFITLVPVDSPLEIETVVDGRDAGFVRVGDPVTIKFETFPYFSYGTAEGTVRVVSADSFHQPMDNQTTASRPQAAQQATGALFYRARITLDEMKLHNLPAGFRVTPGMPVTGDVKIGKRTVLQYMLSRFVPAISEGMREP